MMARRELLVAVLAALLAAGCSRTPSPEERRGWNLEIERLEAEQDSLRARAAVLIAADPRIQRLPQGDVVVAVPTAFIRNVIDRLFRDVANRITLRLSGIKAHVEKKVKKVVTIGEFTVDVNIDKVVGKIGPKPPRIAFGGDSISLKLPIAIKEGRGEATIHFVWDGKHAAGLACGDLDITQKVTGNVIPASYLVTGRIDLRIKGRRVVAALVFPETKLRIKVKPSKESWAAIDSILDEQKHVCGWVLDKVNVPSLLENLTETKGFNVRLPIDKLKPVILPAGIRDSVQVGERSFAIDAQTKSLRIDPDAIWYSAAVKLEGVGAKSPRE
ncbi:MAG TPA: hypothetical protein VFX78_09045 [Candidatus Eisenbacteria bacterium]|nr:hypothetical protein [Candidatus Eisenbacteria bacterium]